MHHSFLLSLCALYYLVVGYLVTEAGIRLPDPSENVSFASIPGGLAALTALPPAGIIQVIGFIGFFELAVMKDITGGEFVGDFRNGEF